MPEKDLTYLDSFDDLQGFEKPKDTGIKALSIVRNDDEVLDPTSDLYIEGAKAGGFVVKTSKLAIPVPFRVIPLEFKQLYIEYEKNRGGFVRLMTLEEGLKYAVDPYKFGPKESKEGTVLQESYSFVVSLPDYDFMVCMIFFQSSRLPDGETWLRKMKNNGDEVARERKIAPWNQIYNINTTIARNTKGSWFMIKPTFLDFVSKEEYTAISSVKQSFNSFNPLVLEQNTSEY